MLCGCDWRGWYYWVYWHRAALIATLAPNLVTCLEMPDNPNGVHYTARDASVAGSASRYYCQRFAT